LIVRREDAFQLHPEICCTDPVPPRPRFLTEATKVAEGASQLTHCLPASQPHCRHRWGSQLTF